MNPLILLLALVLIVISAILLGLFWRERRPRVGRRRPLTGFEALEAQVGRAVESGRQIHVTLGRGRLYEQANPASVSALTTLDYLARKASASTAPPRVTVGDGTLLVVAQDSVRAAYRAVGRASEVPPSSAHFLADAAYPYVYAAGVNVAISEDATSSNILVGRLGAELALMGEAGVRAGVPQIIGTDDPEGMAVATALSTNTLYGEQLLAASAHLEQRREQLASLEVQDVLRWALMAVLLISGLATLIGG
jgi:hypothetical protein